MAGKQEQNSGSGQRDEHGPPGSEPVGQQAAGGFSGRDGEDQQKAGNGKSFPVKGKDQSQVRTEAYHQQQAEKRGKRCREFCRALPRRRRKPQAVQAGMR